MKLVKLYESVIKEGQVESCISQFGMELFSPEFGGDEPNTKLENDYIELIHKFSGKAQGNQINTNMYNMANKLKTCVSYYPDILQSKGYAFRGIKISIVDLLKSFPEIKERIRMGQPFQMVYNAKTPIQSWSNDEDSANDDFGYRGTDIALVLDKFDIARKSGTINEFIQHIIHHNLDTDIPLIMKYRIQGNDFIFKGEYFNYLSNNDDNEILRIDNRPIEVLAKVSPMEFSTKLFDLLEMLSKSNY